jgi:hypothetical protein
MDVIAKDPSPQARLAATYGLMNHVPPDEKRVATIRALTDKVSDDELKGRLTAVLKAYADEKEERDQNIQTPDVVWSEMKKALLNGDVDAAMRFFLPYKADAYRESFKAMSQVELTKLVEEMGPLSRIERDGNEAIYCFKSKVQGVFITFPVHFGKENGKWRILEY